MVIFPAIDIRGGKCVRLFKGDFAQETVFSDKPEEMAAKWEAKGGKFLHLVDLDGALAGKSVNLDVVKKIVDTVSIPVELGGGIRTMENIDEVLSLGVQRVILGSVAVKNPALVKEACQKYGDRVVVGIDAKDGIVAIARFNSEEAFVSVMSTNDADKTVCLPLGAIGASGFKGDVFGAELNCRKLDDKTIELTVPAHQAYFMECLLK